MLSCPVQYLVPMGTGVRGGTQVDAHARTPTVEGWSVLRWV